MSLCIATLYDLYRLLCFLRSQPEKASGLDGAIRELLTDIEAGSGNPTIVRETLRRSCLGPEPMLSWAMADTDDPAEMKMASSPAAGAVVAGILRELLFAAGDPRRVYRLCDSTHNLPLILADPQRHHESLDEMLEDYRTRYCPSFLHAELPQL